MRPAYARIFTMRFPIFYVRSPLWTKKVLFLTNRVLSSDFPFYTLDRHFGRAKPLIPNIIVFYLSFFRSTVQEGGFNGTSGHVARPAPAVGLSIPAPQLGILPTSDLRRFPRKYRRMAGGIWDRYTANKVIVQTTVATTTRERL